MLKLLRGPIGFIAISAFLTVMGFTIVIPVLPFIVSEYVPADRLGLWVGILVAVYALCQFIAAPVLGAISDRVGRKPVLLFCLAGSAVGYVIFGVGGALWVLLLGRVIDGLTGGDISTMFAYVADSAAPEDRGRAFGLLGGAAGIGGLAGPVVGGTVGQLSLSAPLFVAAGVVALSTVWGAFYLPESLPIERRTARFDARHLNPLAPFAHVRASRALMALFATSFLFFCAGTMMQANISVLLKDVLAFGPGRIGLAVCVLAVVDIFAQGYLSGALLPKLGEKRLAQIGLAINAVGFLLLAALALMPTTALLFVAIVVFNLGDGLFQPAFNAIVSNAAPDSRQGQVQGASQGIQSVGRVVGPLVVAAVYTLGASLPYLIGAALVAGGLMILLSSRPDD
ncbi:MAG TPA: MFS transporter [Gemmatimonadaceae bacterium]|jgi:DHA1 family tetracycline resistance protein-like MFS transporter